MGRLAQAGALLSRMEKTNKGVGEFRGIARIDKPSGVPDNIENRPRACRHNGLAAGHAFDQNVAELFLPFWSGFARQDENIRHIVQSRKLIVRQERNELDSAWVILTRFLKETFQWSGAYKAKADRNGNLF